MTITTREGREELRREHRLVNMYIPSEVKANLGLALDGLDIAEKLATTAFVLWALPHIHYRVRVGIRVHWELTAENVRREALTEWDKWCS